MKVKILGKNDFITKVVIGVKFFVVLKIGKFPKKLEISRIPVKLTSFAPKY